MIYPDNIKSGKTVDSFFFDQIFSTFFQLNNNTSAHSFTRDDCEENKQIKFDFQKDFQVLLAVELKLKLTSSNFRYMHPKITYNITCKKTIFTI